jgi:uncharacterized membrane protein YhiD involved in acid resistance
MNNGTVTFRDLIRNSVLEQFQNSVSVPTIITSLLIAFFVGLFIYMLYKRIFSGVLYSKSFNVSLIGMTIVTAMVILAVNSNLILSLGMVGALSIVRFRTPIKDPTDLIFLFWSAAAGIVIGAGFYALAIIGSIIIGLVLFLFVKSASFETPYLMVVQCENADSEQSVYEKLNKLVKRFNVKQKTVTNDQIEMTVELRLKKDEPRFVGEITGLPGVRSAVLISYSGDYVSQ